MLHKETVSSGTLELLKQLMLDENLNDFFLVGGTALSLQIGHRISIDIDLFSLKSFEENKLLTYLETNRNLKLSFIDRNTLKGQIDNIQVDLISHSYPLVSDLLILENIRLASLEDIAAMKFNAIIGNGTRLKDFVDIACLSAYLSFESMIKAYQQKYQPRNPLIILKALFYYDDINFKEPLHMISGSYKWKTIEQRLSQMEKFQYKIFPKLF